MSKRSAEEDNENMCSFFLAKKKRPCRMKTLEGMSYCPHHSHLGSEENPVKGGRIPCPLDPSHFCYESKLQKHLKKCNAREKEKPDFYVENINLDSSAIEMNKMHLSDITNEELLALIKKIQILHEKLDIVTSEVTSMHSTLQEEMKKIDDGFNSFKHLKQQAALLHVMEKHNLLQEASCFVEFGAGKGQLMYWIVQCASNPFDTAFILVDKSAQRHKSDNKLKGSEIQIQRIRIDIQHFYLGKVINIKDKLNKVVAVCKHLCGAATDFAINCIIDTLEVENNGVNIKQKALGLLMALCCHHRCSWNSYVGKFFMEKNEFSPKEFQLLCCMASWATCGQRKCDQEHVDLESDVSCEDKAQEEVLINRYKQLNLTHEKREIIGMQCKRLIDAGRIQYLQNQGYKVELLTYTDKAVSLENVALLATHKDAL